jgi:hypothetical protein
MTSMAVPITFSMNMIAMSVVAMLAMTFRVIGVITVIVATALVNFVWTTASGKG